VSDYPYLPLETIEELAEDLPPAPGFLEHYRQAGGDPDLITDQWDARRETFLCQAMARIKVRKEPLWKGGEPTPRHLELIAWAYSPHPRRVIG
jgi:hypothetical protein